MTTTGQALRAVIGHNVARLRGDKTQEQLSRLLRRRGLKWSRSTINGVEAGRREVDLVELCFLADAFEVPVGALLAGDLRIDLGEERSVPLDCIRQALQSTTAAQLEVWAPGSHVGAFIAGHAALSEHLQRPGVTQLWQRWWPEAFANDEITAVAINLVMEGMSGLVEQTTAKKLGVNPLDLAAASLGLWGQCMADEREARLGAATQPRSRQALRGHVTRSLQKELAQKLRE